MYLLNNKHYLCKKIIWRKKQVAKHEWRYCVCYLLKIQSNLYKATTFRTIQKWSSWTGGRLTKHFYKMATNQMWSLLAGF